MKNRARYRGQIARSFRGRLTTVRKVLVTAAGPNMRPMLDQFSLPLFRRFAQIHDYEVIAEKIRCDEGRSGVRQAIWRKLGFIRQALTSADVVVWLDADVLIHRFDRDILDDLLPGSFQGFVLETIPFMRRTNPNSGVWVMRNCDESVAFLDELDRIGPNHGGRWNDQHAILLALGWHMGGDAYYGARPGRGSVFTDGTCWLPPTWNQLHHTQPGREDYFEGYAVVPDPRIVHFAGMNLAARWAAMEQAANALEAAEVI